MGNGGMSLETGEQERWQLKGSKYAGTHHETVIRYEDKNDLILNHITENNNVNFDGICTSLLFDFLILYKIRVRK